MWQVIADIAILFLTMTPARLVSFSILLGFLGSMLWCGEVDCPGPDEQGGCSALICSLTAGQQDCDQPGSGGSGDHCVCVCHMPSLLPERTGSQSNMLPQRFATHHTIGSPVFPVRLVYHPPIPA
jgi:hypothetical protein